MKLSILPRLIFCILTPVVVGMSLLVFLNYTQARDAILDQAKAELAQVARMQKDELHNIFILLNSVTTNFIRNPQVIATLEASKDNTNPQRVQELQPQVQQAVTDLVKSFRRIASAGVLDEQGRVIGSQNPNIVGTSYADRSYFKTAMQQRAPVSELVQSRSSGSLVTILAIPVFTPNSGNLLGVVFIGVDMHELSQNSTGKVRMKSTGQAYGFTRTGVSVLHNNLANLGKEFGDKPWVRDIIAGKGGPFSYEEGGKRRIGSSAVIPVVDYVLAVEVEEKDLLEPINRLQYMAALLTVVSLLLISGVIFLVVRSMTRRLRKCAHFARSIAEGNLNMAVSAERQDEIGEMTNALQAMVETLKAKICEAGKQAEEARKKGAEARSAMKEAQDAHAEAETARRDGMLAAAEQLEGIVEIVSSASTQLASHVTKSELGAGKAAERLGETAIAMDQMNATVLEVARSAEGAARVSSDAKLKAEQGAGIVDRVIACIHDVECQATQLRDDMTKLGSHAESIGTIMNVISDIADQTNLLALNAAIEAARAGDAGRGFAVVADEVRKLAEKTMQATVEVGNAIKGVQQSAASNIKSADDSSQSVVQATDLARQAGQALKEIVSLVETSADQVNTIATAAEEQSATSEEINRSLGAINNVATGTTRSMAEASTAVTDLSRQAQNLLHLIEEMKRR